MERDDQRWFGERPFPWVLCAVWVGIGLTAEAGLAYAWLCFGNWPDGCDFG